jgi:hypothetical protein
MELRLHCDISWLCVNILSASVCPLSDKTAPALIDPLAVALAVYPAVVFVFILSKR